MLSGWIILFTSIDLFWILQIIIEPDVYVNQYNLSGWAYMYATPYARKMIEIHQDNLSFHFFSTRWFSICLLRCKKHME